MTTIIGRAAIRRRVQEVQPTAVETAQHDPRVMPIAHVICRMGGHIPNIDNEAPGACVFHVAHAVVGLELADTAAALEAAS